MSLEELKKKCEELIGEHIYKEYCDIDTLYDKGCDMEKLTDLLGSVHADIWDNSGASKEVEKYEEETGEEYWTEFSINKYGDVVVKLTPYKN